MAQPVAIEANPPRRRRWRTMLLLVLGGILVVAWALPPIVARWPGLDWLGRTAGVPMSRRVTIGSASLGWLSPVVLRDVEVRDRAGVCMKIKEVRSERCLLRLLCSPRDLGTVRLQQPVCSVHFAGKQSNVEELVAAELGETTLAAPQAVSSRQPQVHFEIVDASIQIGDEDRRLSWKLQGVNAHVALADDDTRTIQASVDSKINDGSAAGTIKIDATVQNPGSPECRSEIKGKFSAFPLALAGTVARRYRPGSELNGYLEGQCQVTTSMDKGQLQVQFAGEIAGSGCKVLVPPCLEPIRLDKLSLPCKLKLQGDHLVVEQAELTCDVGRAALRGELDLLTGLAANVDRPGFDLAVDLDLPRLAERLPRTLRLHRDLKLQSGRVRVECRSVARSEGVVWEGRVGVTDLRGQKGSKPVAWTEPVNVTFEVRDPGHGVPLIDQLHCTSRFLRIDGTTSADRFALEIDADLQRLAEPLAEFVDLGTLQLAGHAHGSMAVRKLPGDRFGLDGEAQFENLRLAGLTRHNWQEPIASLQVSAEGALLRGRRQRVETGSASVRLGKDHIELQLLEPAADVGAGAWGMGQVILAGDVSRWEQRVKSWTSLLDDYKLGGTIELNARVRPTLQTVECPTVALAIRDLEGGGPFMHVREPWAELKTSARCRVQQGDWDLGQTVFRCPTLTVESARLRIEPALPTVDGSLGLHGDIAGLRRWLMFPSTQPADRLAGNLVGRVDLAAADAKENVRFDLRLESLVWGLPASPLWVEPMLKLSGQADYAPARKDIQVARLHGESQYMGWEAHGGIAHLDGPMELALAGELNFDLDKLQPHLRPYLGKDGTISGHGTRPFHVNGPLCPRPGQAGAALVVGPAPMQMRELKGDGALAWKSMHAYGFDVGAAEVRACLQQGWLQMYPIETTINGGRLHLQPNLRLEPGPPELVLLAGPVVEKAALTPALCAGALGFIAPSLANAAEAEGVVSVILEGGRVPLSAPATSEIKGTLILHSARVAPGPLVRELDTLMRTPAPATMAKEARVPFQLIDGRVHHRDLELSFPELTVKTSGSVGLDGSLSMVAETTIPPRWIPSGRLSAALAKKTIRLPIGGTTAQPRIDTAALRSLNASLARDLSEDTIRREVENGLKNLLRPRGGN